MERWDRLKTLEVKLHGCRLCNLVNSRKKLVFGEGHPSADIMFVGEAPGKVENKEGRPFIGRAGKFLRKILQELGFNESNIYITNVVKCHPPYDRDPKEGEIKSCMPHLKLQIELIKPKIIVTLGRISTQALLKRKISITKIHGEIYQLEDGIQLTPIFHPAYLIRNPNVVESSKQDFIKIKKMIGGYNE